MALGKLTKARLMPIEDAEEVLNSVSGKTAGLIIWNDGTYVVAYPLTNWMWN